MGAWAAEKCHAGIYRHTLKHCLVPPKRHTGLMILMVLVSALPFAFTLWFFVGLLAVVWAKSSPSQRRTSNPGHNHVRGGRYQRHLQVSGGPAGADHSLHQHLPVSLMDLHLSLHRRDIGPNGQWPLLV